MNEKDATGFSGDESDRRRLLELHRQYLDSNLTLDTEALRKIWSGNPECVFFNGNGYTYHGLAHWTKLWDFYRDRVKTADTLVGGVQPAITLTAMYDGLGQRESLDDGIGGLTGFAYDGAGRLQTLTLSLGAAPDRRVFALRSHQREGEGLDLRL